MKKKLLAFTLAAVFAMSMCAYAAEDAAEQPEETTEETVTIEEAADEMTEEAAEEIGGYYIVNYAQASDQVNLTIIAEPDLVATAQEAGTQIVNFKEDGTVLVYANGAVQEGTYTAADGKLSISVGEQSVELNYEFIDGLLIARDDDTSAVLYDFSIDEMSHISIDDYSALEISEDAVAVSDEDVESYISSVLEGQTTYEQVTEGTVENGDIVTISYQGILEGEEEPFEGGSSDGITVQLGSGALIDNFEEQLEGKEIGSTVDVTVTFPEDYSGSADLAGKTAVFSTTIQYKTNVTTPELTDEWVKEFSASYLSEELNTVEEFRDFSRSYLEEYVLHTAILNALAAKTSISGYNATTAQMMINYSANSLAYYASSYGYDEETYASMAGYDSAAAYEQAEALSYINIEMIVNKVMVDLGMTYTLEEYNKALEDYLKMSGYSSLYTVDEYKTQAGTAGMWMFKNLEFKYNLAMSALEDRVVLTEAVDTEAEAENAEPVAQVLGGWTLSDNAASIPEDAQKALENAAYTGMSFEPIALLGTQIVAGTNYQILCKGTTATEEPETKLVVVMVYADLEGNSSISNVADFDLGTLETAEVNADTEQLAGGWTVAENEEGELPEDAAAAFNAAMEGLTGVGYVPTALLGTKVIAGTEYAILCNATLVTADPVSYNAVVFVTANADGTNSILNIVPLNLIDYTE